MTYVLSVATVTFTTYYTEEETALIVCPFRTGMFVVIVQQLVNFTTVNRNVYDSSDRWNQFVLNEEDLLATHDQECEPSSHPISWLIFMRNALHFI